MRNSRIRLLIDIADATDGNPEEISYKKGDEFDVLIDEDFRDRAPTVHVAIDMRDYGLSFFNIAGEEPEYEEIPIVNVDINTSLSESTNTKN